MIFPRFAPLALLMFFLVLPARASWISPFISEIHYDNKGADAGELVGVSGPVGLDLSDWQVILYNGADGRPYRSVSLSGQLAGSAGEWAEAYWPMAGMQNGPDAVALYSAADGLIDFVAYEAGLTASAGPASGATARVLPLSEGGSTAIGSSLQRVGGSGDWDWVLASATPGILNPGLVGFEVERVPSMGAWALWLAGIAAWLFWSSVRTPRQMPLKCGVRE